MKGVLQPARGACGPKAGLVLWDYFARLKHDSNNVGNYDGHMEN